MGALYVKGLERAEAPLKAIFHGGGQERGYRSGTENVPLIAGLGTACDVVTCRLIEDQNHMRMMRDVFEAELSAAFGERAVIHGKRRAENGMEERLPNTTNVSLMLQRHVSGRAILDQLGTKVMASVGAACHSAASSGADESRVLTASHVSKEHAMRAVRFSFGRMSTLEEIRQLVMFLKELDEEHAPT
jgi:cysteine sulfinate desulfinase/cysteine desulfurase-like protein